MAATSRPKKSAPPSSTLLLLVRLMDAGVEPLLGRLSDHLYRHSILAVLWVAGASALLLGLVYFGVVIGLFGSAMAMRRYLKV